MSRRIPSLALFGVVVASLGMSRDLQAQTDRWYPTPADSQNRAASKTPSPLTTWQVVLPLRAGIAEIFYLPLLD